MRTSVDPLASFLVGQTYSRRAHIHDVFGGQERGGICTPTSHDVIFAFTGTGERFGYSDHWDGDVFVYSGEGRRGDMQFTRGNNALRDHAILGTPLLLFEATRPKGSYVFLGRFIAVSTTIGQGPDEIGNIRRIIFFNLIREEVVEVQSSSIDVDLQLPQRRGSMQPARQTQTISRIVRDNLLSRSIKHLHNHECQICGATIQVNAIRRYSEAHHLKPLGKTHNGPDVAENIIVVCPNHHAMCDLGAIPLFADQLRCHPAHQGAPTYIEYHNETVFRR